ncbi:MAG TPA: hypothetical protein PK992_05105 [Planctomycetaceae bacterium]|nr:hypothetical protein [Planctomycetaceae bacterium]HRA87420.1 hypothetical protein [Planctomycetaceae bacterium]
MSQTSAFIFAMTVVLNIGCINSVDDSPQFKITTKRDNDKIEVQIENGKAEVSINSPFGISQATIERLPEHWPDAVVLRLHLKGLENFTVTNGKITLNAAVSSHDVRLWKDDNEDSPLDSKTPYWMEIRMAGNDGKTVKTIPLNDGYFEMALPKVFFEGNLKSITLNWIDFYRN